VVALRARSGSAAHRDVGRHVLVLGAERVSDPATERWKTGLPTASVHGQQGFAMIDVLAHTGTHDRDVIHHAREVREKFRDFEAGLPVLRELKRAGHEFGRPADGALDNGTGNRLAVVALQHGLWIEQIHLARAPSHVEHDDALGAGFEVRRPRPKIEHGCRRQRRRGQQRMQGQRAEPTREPAQRFPPRQRRRRIPAARAGWQMIRPLVYH
jgi:hypothetical protein